MQRATMNGKHISTYSEAEFQNLLTADESVVNIDRLRESARYGVPHSVRGEVWKILLGVANPDRSEEMSTRKKVTEGFEKIRSAAKVDHVVMKKLRKDVKRYTQSHRDDFFAIRSVRLRLEELLVVFLSTSKEYAYNKTALVHMLAPFVYCLDSNNSSNNTDDQSGSNTEGMDAYHCFAHMMASLEHSPTSSKIHKSMSKFLMLFRALLPELYTHFEDEELVPNDWALSWLKDMLAHSLSLECLLRLWDTYFACDEQWDMHIYVCLAILRQTAEEMMELESSELLNFLQTLPVLDMDQIIMHAYNIRGELLESKLI